MTKDAAPEKEAKEEKAPKVEQPKANGVSRPKDGTKTGQVWAIADELSEAAGEPAKRKPVLEAAETAGINAATAATQYGRWRKFHGLEGRGTEEAPADDKAEAAE